MRFCQFWKHFHILRLSGFPGEEQYQKCLNRLLYQKHKPSDCNPGFEKPSQRLCRIMSWNIGTTSKITAVRWLFRFIKIPPQITKSMFLKNILSLQLIVCPLKNVDEKNNAKNYGKKRISNSWRIKINDSI